MKKLILFHNLKYGITYSIIFFFHTEIKREKEQFSVTINSGLALSSLLSKDWSAYMQYIESLENWYEFFAFELGLK